MRMITMERAPVNTLVYGDSNAGKTYNWKSFKDEEGKFLISAE